MDAEFPPDDGSLFFSERQYGLEWRRAAELVAEPSLMEGGGDRLDINQVRCCSQPDTWHFVRREIGSPTQLSSGTSSFKTLCLIPSNPPIHARFL